MPNSLKLYNLSEVKGAHSQDSPNVNAKTGGWIDTLKVTNDNLIQNDCHQNHHTTLSTTFT